MVPVGRRQDTVFGETIAKDPDLTRTGVRRARNSVPLILICHCTLPVTLKSPQAEIVAGTPTASNPLFNLSSWPKSRRGSRGKFAGPHNLRLSHSVRFRMLMYLVSDSSNLLAALTDHHNNTTLLSCHVASSQLIRTLQNRKHLEMCPSLRNAEP